MRYEITPVDIENVLCDLRAGLVRRLKEKGSGGFVSSHEILGVITEEYHEALDEVHDNNHLRLRKELLDIAVPCLVGVISIDAGEMES